MAAAKSLTHAEIERALEYIASNANALRNRVMFLLTTNAGLRVSEVADLKLADVLDRDGTLRSEVLLAEQTACAAIQNKFTVSQQQVAGRCRYQCVNGALLAGFGGGCVCCQRCVSVALSHSA